MVWGKAIGVIGEITELLRPVVESMGYQFWGVEYLRGGPDKILRLYIETDEGITLEDCVAVNDQVGPVLDVEDVITQEYHLEVSSPGLERPLFTLEQCAQYIGEKVYVLSARPVQGKRRHKSELVAVSESGLILAAESKVKVKSKAGKRAKTRSPKREAGEDNQAAGGGEPVQAADIELPVSMIEKVVLLPDL